MDDRHAGATYGLKPADALKHLFVVGPTGVGKSTFLFWFALSAIRQGHGILLLDPKGDLAPGAPGGRFPPPASQTWWRSTSRTPTGRWA